MVSHEGKGGLEIGLLGLTELKAVKMLKDGPLHRQTIPAGLLSRCRHPIPSSILVPSEDDQSPGAASRQVRSVRAI